jgi:hypothetical protein
LASYAPVSPPYANPNTRVTHGSPGTGNLALSFFKTKENKQLIGFVRSKCPSGAPPARAQLCTTLHTSAQAIRRGDRIGIAFRGEDHP